MNTYLLQFSGEDSEDLAFRLRKEKRKQEWEAMTEEEREQYVQKVQIMLSEFLEEIELEYVDS